MLYAALLFNPLHFMKYVLYPHFTNKRTQQVKQVAQGHGKVRIQVLNVQSCFQTSALLNHQPPCPTSSAVWALFPQSISTERPAKPPTLLTFQPALLSYTFKPQREEKRKRKEESSGLHLPLHCSSRMGAHFQLRTSSKYSLLKLTYLEHNEKVYRRYSCTPVRQEETEQIKTNV